MTKEQGYLGFSKGYWKANYSEPEEMDGIANAKQHAAYIKAFFDVDYVDVSSVIDFGFGLGHLLKEVLDVFRPYEAQGIEPSEYAYQDALKRVRPNSENMKFKLSQVDLVSWAEKNQKKKKPFDLGICTSVFQYLKDEEIQKVLPVIASRVKYLYFSAPTDVELKRQVEDLDFLDEYAIYRAQKKYLQFLKPHFTVIGNRMLESKVHFKEADTEFTDLLFRF